MLKTMRVAWMGCALFAATLALSETPAPTGTPASPFVKGSAQNGSAKAGVCVACHGVNGNSTNPEWPSLAGQSPVYVAEQLRLFRAGVRNNPLMQPIAASLKDEDIDDLAVYFSQQTPTGGEADPSYWQAGAQLYRSGDGTRDIPACTACHGPAGNGNLAAGYPALRAQHSVYTIKQLNDYASGARYQGAESSAQASRNAQVMISIAKRLSPEDIRNLASYIQGMR